MARQGVVAVVLAGGHGWVTDANQSKLVEEVGGMAIVSRVYDLLNRRLDIFPTFAVVNSKFGDSLRDVLNIENEMVVHQPERTGTAGAVQLALPAMKAFRAGDDRFDFKHLVVLYGDMPLWRPESIAELIDSHIKSTDQPVITMFEINLTFESPEAVQTFGRILRNERGEIIAIREPYEMTAEDLAQAKKVNPSAWVFDIDWLEETLPQLQPHDKGDGFAKELWLPDLVPLAAFQGRKVNVVNLADAQEAMGVNTLAELDAIRAIMETAACQ